MLQLNQELDLWSHELEANELHYTDQAKCEHALHLHLDKSLKIKELIENLLKHGAGLLQVIPSHTYTRSPKPLTYIYI